KSWRAEQSEPPFQRKRAIGLRAQGARLGVEEEFDDVVGEAAAELGGDYALAVGVQPAAADRRFQLRRDRLARQARARLEHRQREALVEAQRIEHEVEGAPRRPDALVAADRRVRAGMGQVRSGMLELPAAQDRLLRAEGELAVRAR